MLRSPTTIATLYRLAVPRLGADFWLRHISGQKTVYVVFYWLTMCNYVVLTYPCKFGGLPTEPPDSYILRQSSIGR